MTNQRPPAGGFGVWTDGAMGFGAPPVSAPEVPLRRCRCGAAVPCAAIVRETSRKMPRGMREEYVCQCGASFKVRDLRSMAVTAFSGAILLAAATLFVMHPPGAAVGARESNQWFGYAIGVAGAAYWIMLATWIAGRVRHPRVASPPLGGQRAIPR